MKYVALAGDGREGMSVWWGRVSLPDIDIDQQELIQPPFEDSQHHPRQEMMNQSNKYLKEWQCFGNLFEEKAKRKMFEDKYCSTATQISLDSKEHFYQIQRISDCLELSIFHICLVRLRHEVRNYEVFLNDFVSR
jgi:hypothetical protein